MTDQIFGKQIAFLAFGCIFCCLVANTKYLRIVIFASVQNKVEPDDSHLHSQNSSFLLSPKQAVRRAKGVDKRSQFKDLKRLEKSFPLRKSLSTKTRKWRETSATKRSRWRRLCRMSQWPQRASTAALMNRISTCSAA